jgi:hypothetical protein
MALVRPPGLTRFRTHDLPGSRRPAGWVGHNARALVGLRVTADRPFDEQPAGAPTPDGRALGDKPWARSRFDIVLAPGN